MTPEIVYVGPDGDVGPVVPTGAVGPVVGPRLEPPQPANIAITVVITIVTNSQASSRVMDGASDPRWLAVAAGSHALGVRCRPCSADGQAVRDCRSKRIVQRGPLESPERAVTIS
jgi:hypothetical protein